LHPPRLNRGSARAPRSGIEPDPNGRICDGRTAPCQFRIRPLSSDPRGICLVASDEGLVSLLESGGTIVAPTVSRCMIVLPQLIQLRYCQWPYADMESRAPVGCVATRGGVHMEPLEISRRILSDAGLDRRALNPVVLDCSAPARLQHFRRGWQSNRAQFILRWFAKRRALSSS